MKHKSVLILSVLLTSMLLVVSASAENGYEEFTANGKMIHYSNYESPDRGSEIVGGTWNVVIVDGVVDFNYFYRELNLREEVEYSPEGTVDLFKGYLTSEDFVVGEGYVEIWGLLHVDKKMWFLDDYSSIEVPPWLEELIPENAQVAWITDFWVQQSHITITPSEIIIENGDLDKIGITLSYHPHSRAELTFWDIPRVKTYDNTLPAGDHPGEVTHRLWIYNIDDMFDEDIVNPGFHVETDGVTLTWVDWEQYADWGDTYADWDFPEEFTIPEESGGGPNFGTDRTELINLDFTMTRQMAPPVIEVDGTYLASFTLEFTDTDSEWCNGYIQTQEGWDLNAVIVPGSFSTDAPLWDWDQWDSHSLWFDLAMDSMEVGKVYTFNVGIYIELTDNACPPIIYIPGFGINHLVDTEWRAGGEGDTVEIPSDMSPEYVTEAWISTDSSYIWTLGRRNEINAYMEEVLEGIP